MGEPLTALRERVEKLTRTQKEALGYLSRRECGLVHAATARVLHRDGLIARHGASVWTDWWEITDAGRALLRSLEAGER